MLFRFHRVFFGAIFLAILSGFGQQAKAAPRFGLWVEAEGKNRPFRSAEEFKAYSEFAKKGRFTDLYCQVYRGGRAWYPSMLADDAPYRRALAQGFDPLRDTINQAHKRGTRVHAWINVLRIVGNREAPLLKTIGRNAAHTDSYGNSLLDYDSEGLPPGALGRSFKLGTAGIWLDAGSERVREYLVATIKDVVMAYPDLDGVHLDMIRYPMSMRKGGKGSFAHRPRFGYSQESIERFYEFAGKKPPPMTKEVRAMLRKAQAWGTWHRAQVTLLVFEIKEMLNQIAPEIELSAAVIASPERAYSEVYQDWSAWRKGGIIDTVIPMNYSRNSELVARQSKYAIQSASRGQVLIGLGSWLMIGNPSLMISQGKTALRFGADGVTLFSLSNLLSPQGELLVREFRTAVLPELK